MSGVGGRLREERLRLGLSQDEFAAVGGVTRRTQTAYESDGRAPDANYLLALRGLGVDVIYVLTGDHLPAGSDAFVALNDDEREILRKYRLLNEAGKGAVEAAMNGYIMAGEFTTSGEPDKRVPRLAANRAAAMDEQTFELVRRAQEDQRRREEERAKRTRKEKS
jgi:transcriptional regulator with XRE-family HTH domain